MPIFISYSQRDSDFVDSLAKNLVAHKHHVWMDRWELALGDSLSQKIEGALVMPCVVDDCTIPLFLRDKLYTDFRKDTDAAFNLVDRSLARISNPSLGQVEEPKSHTD